tara:strand:+ start:826 stop:987 length:162 start_codon:yes stop_codon:yes gene_type:complete
MSKTLLTIGFFITVIGFLNAMDSAESEIGWIFGIPLIGIYAISIGVWKPFKKE